MSKTETKNLYQRMSAVMQDVQYLKKDDSVGSGSYAYRAISEEKVTETIRQSLIQHGLVIFPVEQDHKHCDHPRENNKIVSMSTVDTKYKIVNIDNPAEWEILTSSGTGVDPQDKGVGKAMTYSYKYLLLRTFAIPTGEDPDKVHNNDLEKAQNKTAQQPKAPAATQAKPEEEKAQEKPAITLKEALQQIADAKTAQEVANIWNSFPQFKEQTTFKDKVTERGTQLKGVAA